MKTLLRYLLPIFLTVGALAQATPTVQVDTWAALKAIAIPGVPGKLTAIVKGRISTNDGGGGTFTFTSGSGATDDGGTIAAPNVGTGAWFRQYSGDLNVLWFGVNAAAFQQAIGVAFTNGTSVFVPKGTYNLGAGLTLTPPVELYGDGINETTLNFTAAVDGITVSSVTPGTKSGRIRDMTLIGGANQIGVNGIIAQNVAGLRVSDVYLQGWQRGLYWNNVWCGQIARIIAAGNGNATYAQVELFNCSQPTFDSCWISGYNGAKTTAAGVRLDGVVAGAMIGTHIETTGINLQIGRDATATVGSQNFVFVGCGFENANGKMIDIGAGGSAPYWVQNIAFIDCLGTTSGSTNSPTMVNMVDSGDILFQNSTFAPIASTTKIYNLSGTGNQRVHIGRATYASFPGTATYVTVNGVARVDANPEQDWDSDGTGNITFYTGNNFLALNSSTPSTKGYSLLYTQSGAPTTINTISGGVNGQVIMILALDGNTTLSNMGGGTGQMEHQGGANRLLVQNVDCVQFVYNNGIWTEIGPKAVTGAPANTLVGTLTVPFIPVATGTTNLGNSYLQQGNNYITPATNAVTMVGSTTNKIGGLFVQAVNASSNTMSLYDSSGAVASVFGPAGGLTLGGQVPPGAGNLTLNLNTSKLSLGANSDVVLTWDAANTPAFRNGVNVQDVRIYGSFTDSSNGQWLDLGQNAQSLSANFFWLAANKNGTGTAKGVGIAGSGSSGGQISVGTSGLIQFGNNSANWWNFTTAGDLKVNTDAGQQIGDATHRVKYGFFGGSTETTSNPIITENQTFNSGGVSFTAHLMNIADTASAAGSLFQDWQVGGVSKASITKGGAATFVGNVTGANLIAQTDVFVGVNSYARLRANAADGVLLISNSGLNGLTRLQFGKTDNTGPALGVSTTYLTQTLADGSAGGGIQMSGLMNKYNNISTASGGIPAEYATVDLTAQTAAITSTALYTPTATGMFRISFVLHVTTAASVSSILSGTTGVVLTYTDGDGSVAQTFTMAMDDQTGAVIVPANGNTANTTQATCQGTAVIYAKTGVAINYAIGYTSAGTAMQYSVHGKCEAL